ncbi:hypothetical protein ACOTF2_23245 [Achromobacter xylosoxidans]
MTDHSTKYFALVTFDLRDVIRLGKKDHEVRREVHKKLKRLGLEKLIVKKKKAPQRKVAYNTFTGMFEKADHDAKSLKKYLCKKIKKAIEEGGVNGRVLVVIAEPENWVSTEVLQK